MDSDTQPHCPTCRDSLVAILASDLAKLHDKVDAAGDLLVSLAVHLGVIDDPEE